MSESKQISLAYDAKGKRATLTFPNGHRLSVANVTREQADEFLEKHGAEFQKRDCCFQSVGGTFTRQPEGSSNG